MYIAPGPRCGICRQVIDATNSNGLCKSCGGGQMEYVREKIAFELDERGFHFVATYLTEPKGEALIEISKDGQTVKTILWPAYKIWNIAAHAGDIAADLEEGLSIAGSTGFGGNVYVKAESGGV